MKMIKPEKVKLFEMDEKFKKRINLDKAITAQINPETLKIGSFNQITKLIEAGGKGNPKSSFLITSQVSKLSVQLRFDLTASAQELSQGIADVRELTQTFNYFLSPLTKNTMYIARPMQLHWGSFNFNGYMESVDQIFDLFQINGKPQRATVLLNMLNQSTLELVNSGAESAILETTLAGSVQSMAANTGRGSDWQSIATGTAIEDPR